MEEIFGSDELRTLKVVVATLNMMRWLTGSQWSSFMAGLTWSNFRSLLTTLTAEFCTCWSFRMLPAEMPEMLLVRTAEVAGMIKPW